ncbi:hypothetical protein Hanom_Chr15g01396711 [Helianthus anomalus]
MATKTKPQGPKFKKFVIWTIMAKVPKPQGPKWKFTLKKNKTRGSKTYIPTFFYKSGGSKTYVPTKSNMKRTYITLLTGKVGGGGKALPRPLNPSPLNRDDYR